MNRFAAVLASSLFAVSLLAVSLPSQAQTAVAPTLSLTTAMMKVSLGADVNVNGVVIPGTEAGSSTNQDVTGVQTTIIYDPNVFSLVGSGATVPGTNPFPLPIQNTGDTFTINGTNYTGYTYTAGTVTSNVLTTPTTFLTYDLMVKPTAPLGNTEIYYTSAAFTQAQIDAATSVSTGDGGFTLESYVTYNPDIDPTGLTYPTSFSPTMLTLTVGQATPAPSALVLFAAGATPVLGLLRRRRNA